jgi:transcriptional regulator with XRE-family HTH domain
MNTMTVGDRVRAACARRGWDLQELASRASVSRTTLYHLLEGHTTRPHGRTLNRLADALEVPTEELLHPDGAPAAALSAGEFDRITNPEVDAVAAARPALFRDWDDDDWDELYSTFGAGGALTSEGVVAAAEGINRKRETVRQLHIVLDTHLRVVAEELIDTLYRMVRPASYLSSTAELRAMIASRARRDASGGNSDDDAGATAERAGGAARGGGE